MIDQGNPRSDERGTRLHGMRGAAVKGLLLLVSSCLGLLLCEAVLLWQRPSVSRVITERGLYLPDLTLGVVLTPNFATRFDDGHARGMIRVNSLGHRDAEPTGTGDNRVLLVGDSFTFGALLDQEETIDRWMERQRPGLDVYNLGVSGYNLPGQVEALHRCQLRARWVLYLFFSNDLLPPEAETAIDGYRVSRAPGPDGTPPSDAELRQRIQRVLDHPSRLARLSLRLPLTRLALRTSLKRLIRGDVPLEPVPDAQRTRLVERALEHTLAMRDDASHRGARFAVAIVPSVDEVRTGMYSGSAAAYVEALRHAGMPPIELRSSLRTSDYWAHNLHFTPDGARVAARVLLDAIAD